MIPGVHASVGTGFAKSVIFLFQGERGSPGDQGPMGPRVGVPSLTKSFGPSEGSKDSGTTLTVQTGSCCRCTHSWAVAKFETGCFSTPNPHPPIRGNKVSQAISGWLIHRRRWVWTSQSGLRPLTYEKRATRGLVHVHV